MDLSYVVGTQCLCSVCVLEGGGVGVTCAVLSSSFSKFVDESSGFCVAIVGSRG